MKNLQDATELICDLKGSIVALDALLSAMLAEMPPERRETLAAAFRAHAEVARTVLLHAPISDHTIAGFERDTARLAALIEARRTAPTD